MSTKTIWGQVTANRDVQTGSGNFSVGDKVETGFYNIYFDPDSFNDTPAVVGTIMNTSSHAPVFYINSCDNAQFTAEIRSSATQDRYDNDFFFIATGTTDDD